MRLIRFYHRLHNQYQKHRYSLSIWTIMRIAWAQSNLEMVEVVMDRSVIPIIDIDIDKEFDEV